MLELNQSVGAPKLALLALALRFNVASFALGRTSFRVVINCEANGASPSCLLR